jgi:hypothetical protein
MAKEARHANAVKDLARTVHELSHIDIPELSLTDDLLVEPQDESQYYDLQQSDDWWDTRARILFVIDDILGHVTTEDNPIPPSTPPNEQYHKLTTTTEWTNLTVKVHVSGELHILAEYATPGNLDSWTTLHQGRVDNYPADPIELGREVASAELAILAAKTKSDTVTLDYWQTTLAPNNFSQQDWGRTRGVSRQTINDQVHAAKNALCREYGPTELHTALNNVMLGDTLDFAYIKGDTSNRTGSGVFRVEELVTKFGDGNGHIRCRNDVDGVVTDIREMEESDDQRVAIEQNGELAHIGGYVSVM